MLHIKKKDTKNPCVFFSKEVENSLDDTYLDNLKTYQCDVFPLVTLKTPFIGDILQEADQINKKNNPINREGFFDRMFHRQNRNDQNPQVEIVKINKSHVDAVTTFSKCITKICSLKMYSEARDTIEKKLKTIPELEFEKNLEIQQINLDDYPSLGAAADSLKEFDWIILTWSTKYHNVIDTYYEFLDIFRKKSQDFIILVIPCDCSDEFIKDFQEIKTNWINTPANGNFNFEAIAFEDTYINEFILKFFKKRVIYAGLKFSKGLIEDAHKIKTFRVSTDWNLFGLKGKDYRILVLLINFGVALLDISGNKQGAIVRYISIPHTYVTKRTTGGGQQVVITSDENPNDKIDFKCNIPIFNEFEKHYIPYKDQRKPVFPGFIHYQSAPFTFTTIK